MSESEILGYLKRIEEWLAIVAKTQLGPILQTEIADKRMAELWQLTGKATQREVKTKLNMSADTISSAWQRWERLGLLVREGKEYRRVI
jgi:DNA-binding MarR family transcriptional regulator